MFRRNKLPVQGFVVAQAAGHSQGQKDTFSTRIVFPEHRDYWMNAVVPALVARLIAPGNCVQPGVHFLADAVDPVVFTAELRKAGVELAESLAEVL